MNKLLIATIVTLILFITSVSAMLYFYFETPIVLQPEELCEYVREDVPFYDCCVKCLTTHELFFYSRYPTYEQCFCENEKVLG